MINLQSIIFLGWIASVATILAVIFVNYPLQQLENQYPAVVYGLYDALSRVTWAMAMSFIVFACHFGYGGPINWILSLPQWQPISRLTYAMYLLHLPVILLILGQSRTSSSFSELNGVTNNILLTFCKWINFAFGAISPFSSINFLAISSWPPSFPLFSHWLSNRRWSCLRNCCSIGRNQNHQLLIPPSLKKFWSVPATKRSTNQSHQVQHSPQSVAKRILFDFVLDLRFCLFLFDKYVC